MPKPHRPIMSMQSLSADGTIVCIHVTCTGTCTCMHVFMVTVLVCVSGYLHHMERILCANFVIGLFN